MHDRQTLSDVLQAQAVPDTLARLILAVGDACQHISAQVGQGALAGVLGSLATQNVQGEVQQTLDVMANDILLQTQASAGCLAAMASEEMETIHSTANTQGEYLLLFDPLDGSSNIAVNVSIGTIFSVLRAPQHTVQAQDFLQAGRQQIAAGYAIYGPQTQLVFSLGQGVMAFTLDRQTGTWWMTQAALRIPEKTQEFAINMSNMRHWDAPVQRYIQDCLAGKTGRLGKDYNMRWIASMVADVHRVLNRGGIFMYPRDQRPGAQSGKLRLLYEANPMGFLVEQAGGLAINGEHAILEIQPTGLHERTAVILGSREEVERVWRYGMAEDA